MKTQSTDFPADPRKRKGRRAWIKIAAAIAGSVAVLILLGIVAASLLLYSPRVHSYLLHTAERKASDRLGAPVHLQNFTVHLGSLSLDLYGLTIDGAAPYPSPPLLQVEHLGAAVRVVSIFRREWYLNEIRVDRPVVRLFTGSQGLSNLPKLKSDGGGHLDVFQLGVRHAVLDQGIAYYDNQKSAVEADLDELAFRSSFADSQQKYLGSLSYRDGKLRLGALASIPHELDAQFEASPQDFHLTKARLTSGPSQLILTADLEDYGHPKVQAHYEALIDGGQIRGILHAASVPVGMIHASGVVKYVSDPTRPALRLVTVAGNLSSPRLDVHIPPLSARIDDLAASYSLADGNAAVRSFRAHLLGGELAGDLTMEDLGGASHSQLHASLRGISLAALKRLAPASGATRKLALGGVLNARANAAWGKTLADLVVHTDATIDAGLSPASKVNPAAGVVPVNASIHGTYRAATGEIVLHRSYVRTPGSMLALNGALSKDSSLALGFTSNDLGELEPVAALLRAPMPGHPVKPLGLAGTASFEGTLRGSTSAPHLTGRLLASNLRVEGTAWRLVRADLDLSPSLAAVKNADIEPATRGRISLNASAGLKRWSFTEASNLQLEMHASQLNVADLLKLAGLEKPVEGTLQADIRVHGTEMSPIGQGSLSLAHAQVYGEPLQSATLVFSGTGNEVHGNLAVHLPAGTMEGTASVQPGLRSYKVDLTANRIHLDRLHALNARNIETQGVLDLNASGQGTFNNPQLDATLEIPSLQVEKQAITGFILKVAVANHLATASLDSHGANTTLRAQAKVGLTGDYPVQATLDTQAIPLAPLVALYAPGQAAGLSGETELHATVQGPLKKPKLLEAHATLPILKLAYNNTVQLAAASPIHLDYKNEVLVIERAAIRGADTNLEISASIPANSGSPMSLLLVGTVNLRLAGLLSPGLRSSGELKFNINSSGAHAGPNGQIEIVDANLATDDLPLGLQHGDGTLVLTGNRLNISSFKATVGGGSLTAQGGIVYRPAIQFDLGATARGLRLLYPQGVRESLDADLRLAGTQENALLGGRVGISDVSFTPGFDLTSFIGQLSGGAAPPPTGGFSQNLRLNLAVSTSSNLNLVSRTLSIDGAANLQVRGTAQDPVILGRASIDNGDIIFNGDRFVLNGGTIEFVNPAQTEPVVNLAVSTTIQQYNISLRFNGPIDQLRTNYTSDPSLPAADIINLLAFGQTTEANAANPSTPGNQAAESLIASQVSSQVTSRISKVAGISQLSINPILAGGSSQGPPGANITIQQRVTGRLFVTFSTNVASTEDQVIMGQYQLSPRVAVTVTRDQNGGFAFDTSIRKTW